MYLDLLVGNNNVVDSLKKSLNSGKFMHSVLICGQKGTGANFTASLLCADYLCRYNSIKGSLNDVLCALSAEYIVLEGTGANGEIPVSAIRQARREIYNTSLGSNGRVLHIKGADKLNTHSANALLKVLEEPPEGVLFILTAPSAANVLQTITSRCAIYNLSAVSTIECESYLQNKYNKTHDIAALAKKYSTLFGGNIGFCINMIESENGKAMLSDAENILTSILNFDEYTVLQTLSKYEKSPADAKQLFVILLCVCNYNLKLQNNANSKKTIAKLCDKISYSVNLISSNVNIKLVLSLFCTGIII